MQRFDIPIRPKPKQRPRFSMGHTYTPKETQEYEKSIRNVVKEQMTERYAKWAYIKMDFNYALPKSATKKQKQMVDIAPVIHTKRPDLDNLQKSVLDALNGILWEDDAIVWAIVAQKHYDKADHILIQIEGE